MLKRTSRFVLEVLPYLFSVLIAAVVIPGFLYSRAHGTEAVVMPNVPGRGENAPELMRWNHAVASDRMLLDRPAKTAGDKLAYR
jgi:hypothetical protein